MQYKKEICSNCGKERYIVNQHYKLCSECNSLRLAPKRKKQKAVNKISEKQLDINKKYSEIIKEFDLSTPKYCTGCGKSYKQVKLSHSHIISRNDCVKIGMPELIYDKKNITYHCLSIGEHKGCHEKWHGNERASLLDYQNNLEYISSISSEMYFKYKVETVLI